MANLNFIFLLSLSIIGIGYLVKKLNIISEEDGKGIVKIILNVTLPALILQIITNIDLDSSYFFLILVSIGFSLLVLSFGLIIFRNQPKEIKGIALMTIIGYNIGLFAYPLIEGIFGLEGLQYIAIYDIGNAFVIFGLAYSIGAIFSPKNQTEDQTVDYRNILKKISTSIPLLTCIAAIILNLINFSFPIFVSELLDIISRANMALTLLLLGIYLNFKFEKADWNIVLKILIIRYAFGLIVGLALFFLLPFNILYRTILLIALILPVGMAYVPFSVELGFNERLTGIIVNFSIIISFILMWTITLWLGV